VLSDVGRGPRPLALGRVAAPRGVPAVAHRRAAVGVGRRDRPPPARPPGGVGVIAAPGRGPEPGGAAPRGRGDRRRPARRPGSAHVDRRGRAGGGRPSAVGGVAATRDPGCVPGVSGRGGRHRGSSRPGAHRGDDLAGSVRVAGFGDRDAGGASPGPRRRRGCTGARRLGRAAVGVGGVADRPRCRRRSRAGPDPVAGERLVGRPLRTGVAPGTAGRPAGRRGAHGDRPVHPRPALPGSPRAGRRHDRFGQVRVPPGLGLGPSPRLQPGPGDLPVRRLQGRGGVRGLHGPAAHRRHGDRSFAVPGPPGAEEPPCRDPSPGVAPAGEGGQGPHRLRVDGRSCLPAQPGDRRR